MALRLEPLVPRVLVVVCDSWGVGGAPDAAAYADEGSDTLGNTSRAVGGIHAPALESLGLGLLTSIEGVAPRADAGTAHGWAVERSAGKDTTTGHWEMMGIRLDEPFPLYPDGFPPEIVEPFERAIGHQVLGNEPASGTKIIARLGEEHLATGDPIVYTSGDSVFQIACHKAVVPLDRLYEWCRIARELLVPPHRVGRVIARPFEGEPGAFVRSPERRDLSVPPPGPTVLDALLAAAVPVYGVGKIQDIFDRQGISEACYSDSNDHGVDLTVEYLGRPAPSFVFTNLVDFDSKYGHRNDPTGYAAAVEAFDRRLPELIESLDGGVMLITGDHGCDPTTPPTDHSRERTPLLAAGVPGGAYEIGVRDGFGDLGCTVATLLGVQVEGLVGSSFTDRLGFGPLSEGTSGGG
ncbi:MAG TPA: phosphopentomutase [Actinomycetota bacterium]|nr:phosphopentomutase [Actinomycetota bacterium]